MSLLCWFALSPQKATVETRDRTPARKQSATHAARAGVDEAAERTLSGDWQPEPRDGHCGRQPPHLDATPPMLNTSVGTAGAATPGAINS
ncbi:hypothetical protein AAur_pTC10009 (plasmid) [Paenarthrobacter aurescens TC1]|uniref:Uncharacterized protein n=1 Tax=Paenarthrobacter aurescens (strain TC1) TaxID=290340 RepID=A1RCC1_PAEAT|nr:hypothetical protein AAur_pTC10009 [Paenarthrobacter aurescens TC1]